MINSILNVIVYPILIAIVSGYYFYKLGAKDQKIMRVVGLLDQVEEMGVEYWSIDESNQKSVYLSKRIKWKLKEISNDLIIMPNEKRLLHAFVDLRKEITGDDFDCSFRKKNLGKIDLIQEKTNVLKSVVSSSGSIFKFLN